MGQKYQKMGEVIYVWPLIKQIPVHKNYHEAKVLLLAISYFFFWIMQSDMDFWDHQSSAKNAELID